MTPKEKAIELIDSFYKCMPFKDVKLTSCNENKELIIEMEKLSANQCALTAIDKIISHPNNKFIAFSCFIDGVLHRYTEKQYWQEVRNEIEKI